MTPRYYQQDAIDSIFNDLMNTSGHPVVAMPTGTGKSVVIAGAITQCIRYYPRTRFAMLTHVKELVEQNANKLTDMWAGAPLGINCAGLKRRDTMHPIIFGSIGSSVNNIEEFGHRDVCFIDEAHRVSPKENTSYVKSFKVLKQINPNIRFVALTATQFRMGQGLITNDGVFTHTCYDITGIEAFNRLIREGYLSPLYPKPTKTKLDISDVKITGGEYNLGELQAAVDKNEVTQAALKEVLEAGYDRRSWLVFASGVDHAEHISEQLNAMGIATAAVHGDTKRCTNEQRDRYIKDFKFGKLRCLVNNNILTTGFDHPPIDLIVMLRPTTSPGLWVQMLGRGTRPCEGKNDCLVLDFAGNTMSLGPINDPRIPKAKGKAKGVAPAKLCLACNTYNHTKATHCIKCGNEFTFEVKIQDTASTQPLMVEEIPVTEMFDVTRVIYNKQEGNENKKPMIKVTYMCGVRQFVEWVCLDHSGYPKHKANNWWRTRHGYTPPEPDEFGTATDKAMNKINELLTPTRIKVWLNKKYPEILSYEY
jgi:DNA repair protein RadD